MKILEYVNRKHPLSVSFFYHLNPALAYIDHGNATITVAAPVTTTEVLDYFQARNPCVIDVRQIAPDRYIVTTTKKQKSRIL